MFLLKLSFRPWRQTFLSQFISVLSLAVLLFFIAFLLWLQSSLQPIVNHLRSDQVWTVYLKPDSTSQEKIVDEIQTQLGASANAKIEYVGSGDFIDKIKAEYPELALELIQVGKDLEHIVPRYLSISGNLMDLNQDMLLKHPSVDRVENSEHRFRHTIGVFETLRWISRILAGCLFGVAIVGLIHLAKTNDFSFKESLSVMRLWGASHFQLRVPSLISSVSVGLLGGVLGAVIWNVFGHWFVSEVKNVSPLFQQFEWNSQFVLQNGSLLVFSTGILLSLIASFSHAK